MRRPPPNALARALRGGRTAAVTPPAGVAWRLARGRRRGVRAAADRFVPAKNSWKGWRPGQCGEGVGVLSALGGAGLGDFDGRRRERGLAALLGYDLPVAAAARQGRARVHAAPPRAARPRPGRGIPEESAALAGWAAGGPPTGRASGTALPPERTVRLAGEA